VAPLFCSLKIFSQLWLLSLSSWVSRFCTTVETWAYQIFKLGSSETATRDAI
jgi:hypothetical protein